MDNRTLEKFDELLLQDGKFKTDQFEYQWYFEQLCLVNGVSGTQPEEVNERFEEIWSEVQKETVQKKQKSEVEKVIEFRLKSVLSLPFIEEKEKKHNYMKCLVNFLQSPSLVAVTEEEDDHVLHFKSREALFHRLKKHCNIYTEASLKKLEQRAAFRLLPGRPDYKLLVYLREYQDRALAAREVFSLLKDCEVRVKQERYEVRVSHLSRVIEIIANRDIYEKAAIAISSDNLIYRDSHKGIDYLNREPCVTEKQFLRILSRREREADIAGHLAGLVRRSKVKNVIEDWNQQLVFTFGSVQDYKSFLLSVGGGGGENPDKGGVAIVPSDNIYVLVTQFKIDIRDFFQIDPESFLSRDSREIHCRKRVFPFLCFLDEYIMRKYSLKLSDRCIIQQTK